jgi:excisionase family DNA binding protein
MSDQSVLPELLRVPDVSRALGTNDPRTRELIRTGVLKAVYIGRQVRVAEGELRAFIERGGHRLPGGWRREAR